MTSPTPMATETTTLTEAVRSKPTMTDAVHMARRMLQAVGVQIEAPADRYAVEMQIADILFNEIPGSAFRAAVGCYMAPDLESAWHDALRGTKR